MKIESSQLYMQAEHQSETQSATMTALLPPGYGQDRATFDELFQLLRQTGQGNQLTSQNGSASLSGNTAQEAGNLVANIAGAKKLFSDDDQQTRLLKLVNEMLAALEAMLFKNGSTGNQEGPSSQDINSLAQDIMAADQESNSPDQQWTRVSFAQIHESEQLCFSSQGCVRTSDGREISFDLGISMSRESNYSTLDITRGSRALLDPLVLNFPGDFAELSGQRIEFDLNADGAIDSLPLLSGASGYIAFDRNGDGRINDGSELFGGISGNGFADLAALDEDNNGWIDDGDSAFAKLMLWRPGANGEGELLNLKEMGVGALALQSAATPFEIKDDEGELQACVRRSGVWLAESGGCGSIQHLDVAA